MSNIIYNATINYQNYFEISKTGKVSLKAEYRGVYDGSNPESNGNGLNLELPEMLVIPDMIGDTLVRSLAPGMFYGNKRVKGITLPSTVTEIPDSFCYKATNLQTVSGTERIEKIGYGAFACTSIKNALFPNLTELEEKVQEDIPGKPVFGRAFMMCPHLEVVDIGRVTIIPQHTFMNCYHLRKVIRKIEESETVEFTIKSLAFSDTHSLKDLAFLNKATNVEDNAFFFSSISATSLPTGNKISDKAFPTSDNSDEFWMNIQPTTCCNRLATKLSQHNPAWADKTFLSNGGKYKYGCALFATMHIHSAITGKYYRHPDEFVNELKAKGLTQFLNEDTWPGNFELAATRFNDLGYRAVTCGTGTTLTSEHYAEMANALAAGAYIYTQVSTTDNVNRGHAVVIYGINENDEVCVLDSAAMHEQHGFEPNDAFYTYTIPFPNIVGPDSDFIIVYPPENKSVSDWTVCTSTNAFTSASKPSHYPENQVTTCYVTDDEGVPFPNEGILTTYRVGGYAYRTFVPYNQATLYMQMMAVNEDVNDRWLAWSGPFGPIE